ncbi:MAG: NADH-quinone oxidoreductase subunit H [Planctomycetia bacterium]|nr:NADH-quinone oxidoreductase subunit H [Planctomycetia bacterium]
MRVNDATVWALPTVWVQSPYVDLDRFTLMKWGAWLLVGFFGVFPGIVAYMVWGERKVAARFQDRIGPNRVGPLGLLQPIADAIKLITKENIVPGAADQWVHLLAPVLILVSAFLVLAVIPFGVGMAAVNLPSGMIYLVAVSSLSPPGLLAFVLLVISSIAEVNRTPFDLPEAESEIIAGYHTEYSGMRFGLFFLAEYMSVFGVSCLGTALFLGGGSIVPFPPLSEFPVIIHGSRPFSFVLVNAILISVFMVKVSGFIFLMFWVRATLPRMRVDRLMNFAWKYMVPLSIANVLVAAVWYELVLRPGPPAFTSNYLPNGLINWALGWLVTGPIVLFLVWFVIWFNRRVRSAGEEIPSVTHGPRVTTSAAIGAR